MKNKIKTRTPKSHANKMSKQVRSDQVNSVNEERGNQERAMLNALAPIVAESFKKFRQYQSMMLLAVQEGLISGQFYLVIMNRLRNIFSILESESDLLVAAGVE